MRCRAVLVAVVALAGAAGAAWADEFKGEANAISGNEIEVGKRKVRLFGISAPELKEICEINDAKVKCGIVAWSELIKLVDGQLISCDTEELPPGAAVPEPGATYATCYIGETDVNEAMVRSGWASAVPEQTDRYEVDETDARQSERGFWAASEKRRSR